MTTLTALRKHCVFKKNLESKGKRKPWMLSFAEEVFLILILRIFYQDAAALGQHQAGGVGFVAALPCLESVTPKNSTWEITLNKLCLLKQELWEGVLCDLAWKQFHLYLHEGASPGCRSEQESPGRREGLVCRRDHGIRSNLSLDPTMPHHALHPPVCDGTLPEVKEFPG